jgi:uncharacterized protein (DUF1800 family)
MTTQPWAPYVPSAENPWTRQKAGHLFRRASFGPTRAELDKAMADGPAKTIDALLTPIEEDADFQATSEFMASPASLPPGAPQQRLSAWWLARLLKTQFPLREKLCLFWHNHFATSNAKVQNARMMLGQYELIQKHALGSFKTLLHAITLDPAMLVWLDTVDSKKGQPNENYARELMELFSLGIGNYTETDIREAARAFTGYFIEGSKGVLRKSQHDTTKKTVFGQTGSYDAAGIVDLCLNHPACPKFIVRKLYSYFVSETATPTDELLAPLVEDYTKSGMNTARVVETILRSNHFFSAAAYRAKVKSPVEFAVGMVRALEGRAGPLPLAKALDGLGQVLFAPPSVKGWDGGTTWLNGQTLLFRQNLALAVTSGEDSRFQAGCDPAVVLSKHQVTKDPVGFFLDLFLQNDCSADAAQKLRDTFAVAVDTPPPPFWTVKDARTQTLRHAAHWVLTLPEYQLN